MSEAEARTLEALLRDLRDVVDTARTMPMSASVLVNRDETLALIDEALRAFPGELRHARWLLKERQEYLDSAKREADGLLDTARVQAERMVERSDIVREARRSAQEVLADAEAEARRLHHQAEDYVDQRLAALETLLDKTITGIRKGRERLQVDLPEPEPPDEDEVPVFDQDQAPAPATQSDKADKPGSFA
jgi:F0F1-type ATP synthase membrane subunit b/b'